MCDTIGAFSKWPPRDSEWAYGIIPPGKRDETSCGPRFRLKLIAIVRQAIRNGWDDWAPDVEVEVSLEEAWFLDAVLSQFPTRRYFISNTPTAQSLATLQTKVWDLLIAEYADELPAHLLPDTSYDASASVLAEVEQFLQSVHDPVQEDDE